MIKNPKIIRFMVIMVSIIMILIIIVFAFMRQAKFGSLPKGERLERIEESPNYADGKFRNIEVTPDLAEGISYLDVLSEFLFKKTERAVPVDFIPTKKSIISDIDPSENVLIWFGHSSYYMQLDGKKILVDPVFSGSSSPIASTTKAFKGTDRYTADDFTDIDYLFITHDHWDHLDYKTILELKPKVGMVICGLGLGQHLAAWDYDESIIIESDWGDEVRLEEDFIVNTVTSRHFSGRGFKRNKSLWVSFVLNTPSLKIFIGGDGGYGKHFAQIGEKFGPFDLAILENGQYNEHWKYIHMMPEEVLQAAKDLNATKFLPVHSAKFKLARHSWDEPLKRISKLSKTDNIKLLTPMIGEKVDLDNKSQVFSEWWIGVN